MPKEVTADDLESITLAYLADWYPSWLRASEIVLLLHEMNIHVGIRRVQAAIQALCDDGLARAEPKISHREEQRVFYAGPNHPRMKT